MSAPRENRCETCAFWEGHGAHSDTGECHRHAPYPEKRVSDDHYEHALSFPVTSFLHWCGEHKSGADNGSQETPQVRSEQQQ